MITMCRMSAMCQYASQLMGSAGPYAPSVPGSPRALFGRYVTRAAASGCSRRTYLSSMRHAVSGAGLALPVRLKYSRATRSMSGYVT